MKPDSRLTKCVGFLAAVVAIFLIGLAIQTFFFQSLPLSNKHILLLQSEFEYLDESHALELGKSVLEAEGFEPSDFLPVDGSPSYAPDGRKDIYFYRNVISPKAGIIKYVYGTKDDIRAVQVEFEEGDSGQLVATFRHSK
jgi:hypothetical protein